MTRTTYIVDDDDGVRAALYCLLESRPNGHIRAFGSGEAFLEAAPDLEPGVLLLDLNMPGMGGMEVLEALQASDPEKFAVLILTGNATVPLALDAMRGGVVDFVEKPCGAVQLFETVDAAHAAMTVKGEATAIVDGAKRQIAGLSGRERDVLTGLLEGQANKAIALALDISSRTVEIYRSKLMAKLGVRSLPAAMRIAFTAGLVSGGGLPRAAGLSGIMLDRDSLIVAA